jgi:two-component system sensor histidine kinase FlrB
VLLDLLEEVASLEEAEAARGEVELRCDAPAELDCLGDPVQLRRAIHNLVRNALQAAQAAPAPRRVTLSAEEQDGEVAVRIHNTGAAIPKQVEERLFEPFFTTREKGTGLGLAFVREIALDHGGAIEVDSGDERGTTFTLRLPRRA